MSRSSSSSKLDQPFRDKTPARQKRTTLGTPFFELGRKPQRQLNREPAPLISVRHASSGRISIARHFRGRWPIRTNAPVAGTLVRTCTLTCVRGGRRTACACKATTFPYTHISTPMYTVQGRIPGFVRWRITGASRLGISAKPLDTHQPSWKFGIPFGTEFVRRKNGVVVVWKIPCMRDDLMRGSLPLTVGSDHEASRRASHFIILPNTAPSTLEKRNAKLLTGSSTFQHLLETLPEPHHVCTRNR